MSNVTPIRGSGPSEPAEPNAKPRRRRREKGEHLRLVARVEGEEFDTLRIINGLRGVCTALDRLTPIEHFDPDLIADLAQAARVLSAMVASRTD